MIERERGEGKKRREEKLSERLVGGQVIGEAVGGPPIGRHGR